MKRSAFLSLSSLSLAAVAHPALAQSAGPVIAIAGTTNDSTTSALYAVKAGLFKQAGLNVDLQALPGGPAIVAAVAGGSLQIGDANLLSVIEAHSKHVPFTLIATSVQYDGSNAGYIGLVVGKDSTVRGARDLDGATIACPGLADLNTISTMAWMDKNGGDSSTAHFIEMPPGASLQAVASGKVGATVLITPFLGQGLQSGAVRLITNSTYSAIAPRFLQLAWFTTQGFANANPDAIRRFARVMHDAATYCNAHQSETAPLLADFAKLDPATVQTMARVHFADYLTAPMLQPMIDVAARYKVIDAPFDAKELISPLALKAPSR